MKVQTLGVDGDTNCFAGLIEHHAGDRRDESFWPKMLGQNGVLVSGHANAHYRAVSTCRAQDEWRLHPTFLAGAQYSSEMRGKFVDHGNLRRRKIAGL